MRCVGCFFKFKRMERKNLIVESVKWGASRLLLAMVFLERISRFQTICHLETIASCHGEFPTIASHQVHTPQRNMQSLGAQKGSRARLQEQVRSSFFMSFFYCITESFGFIWGLGIVGHFMTCCYLRWIVSSHIGKERKYMYTYSNCNIKYT